MASIGARAAKGRYGLFVQPAAVMGEAAEDNAGHRGRRWQRIGDGADRDASRTLGGKAVDPGRNRWKGYGRQPVHLAELNRAAIAGGEQIVLAERAAIPHRPNRVDHMPGR